MVFQRRTKSRRTAVRPPLPARARPRCRRSTPFPTSRWAIVSDDRESIPTRWSHDWRSTPLRPGRTGAPACPPFAPSWRLDAVRPAHRQSCHPVALAPSSRSAAAHRLNRSPSDQRRWGQALHAAHRPGELGQPTPTRCRNASRLRHRADTSRSMSNRRGACASQARQ